MTPPSWLANMPSQNGELPAAGKKLSSKEKALMGINGDHPADLQK